MNILKINTKKLDNFFNAEQFPNLKKLACKFTSIFETVYLCGQINDEIYSCPNLTLCTEK